MVTDELADAVPQCPSCLRTYDVAGEPPDLVLVCDCGVTPVAA